MESSKFLSHLNPVGEMIGELDQFSKKSDAGGSSLPGFYGVCRLRRMTTRNQELTTMNAL